MILQKQQFWTRARQLGIPATRPSRTLALTCSAVSSPFKVQLLHPTKVDDADKRPLLVFLPGTDGTGQAVVPQIPGLVQAGYDIRTLYIPPDDRSGWQQLQAQTLYLLSVALAARPPGPHNVQVTIVAESFGGCLALRIAAAAPQLVKALVLVNPATSYNQSLSGLSALVSSTNLLGLFPQDLYNTAQAVLLPFLVDIDRVGPEGAEALRSMIFMEPPPDFETEASQRLGSVDDAESDSAALTVAAEKRRLQVTSSATFTTTGPGASRAAPHTAGGPRLPGNRGSSSSSNASNLTAAAAAVGVFSRAAGGAGWGGGSVFAPAAAANFRSNLMRSGNLTDRELRNLQVPTLVITSAKDRMLPSIAEGARLARLIPHSRRVILPDSGHAALLERGMDLAAIMRGSGITPSAVGPTASRKSNHSSKTGNKSVTAQGKRSSLERPGPGAAGGTGAVLALNSASNGSSSSAVKKPLLLNVVGDDTALVGVNKDGPTPPRPATLFPPEAPPAATAAAAAGSGSQPSSSTSQPSVSAAQAAGAAAALASAAMPSAGGAVAMAADVGESRSSSSSSSDGTGGRGGSIVGPAASGDSAVAGTISSNVSTPGTASNSDGTSNSRRSSSSNSTASSSEQRDTAGEQDLAWDQWSQYLAPWRDLVSPVLLGQEHLPALAACERPLLFVGNHQKMGLYDMPLLAYELYMRGFKVKGLAHPGHWAGPLGPFFEQFGAVKAGPMTAYKLLKANEQVLLFPGGAKEVNKRVGQEYQLFWKDTPDFVRLAARCGAIIVPFAAVGADDAYDVIMEVDDLLQAPVLGDMVKAALQRFDPTLDPQEAALPLTRLPGLPVPTLVPVPNLQRLYFKICSPVDTLQLGLDVKRDAADWQQLYDDIKATVLAGMQELLEVRAADDQQDFGARVRKAVDTILPALSITRQPPASTITVTPVAPAAAAAAATATAAQSQLQPANQQPLQ